MMLEGDPVNCAAEHSAEHAGSIHCRGQNISAWYPALSVETSFASTTAGICSNGLRPPLSRGMQGTRLRCALVSKICKVDTVKARCTIIICSIFFDVCT